MFDFKAWACAASLACFGSSAVAQAAPAATFSVTATANLPPAEAFYRRADVTNAQLSPSGRWLAVLSTLSGERATLVVFDVQGDAKPSVAARFSDLDVHWFAWVNEERLVFNTFDHDLAYGEVGLPSGLFSVRRDGTELRTLVKIEFPQSGERERVGREPLSVYHRLLHVPGDGSDDVIVGESRYDSNGEPLTVVPKRLNVVNGIASLVALRAPANVIRWWFDSRGEARMALTRNKGREGLYWRASADAPWDLLEEHEIYKQAFWPHSIDATGNLYVLRATGASGTKVLTRFDFATRQPVSEPLVSTPGFDFRGSIVTETLGSRALGVRVETDAETTAWFEPRLMALQKEADQRSPGRVNRLTCRRCDDENVMVVLLE